jgi:pimeloyl-ACP methyl ester carboxylesterase
MRGRTRITTSVALAASIVAFSSAAAVAAKTPAKPAFRDACGTAAEKKAAVVFRASDGTRLVGLSLGTGQTGVVLAHQLRGNLCRWLPFARVLAKSGYRVLAFDFRNHGSSAINNGSLSRWALDRDVAAAGRFLVGRGVQKLFVAGESMGGTASLVAASQLAPQLAGVISLSGPGQFAGLDAAAAAAQLEVPSVLVASNDDVGFVDDARALFEKIPREDKKLEIVPGPFHGTTILSGPSGQPVRALLLEFLRSH